MEKRIISDKYFDKLSSFGHSCNSILYRDGDDLIKILYDPECGDTYEKRENKFQLLERIVEPEFVLPKYLVYVDEIKTDNLRGYGMDYLEDYKVVSSIINNKEYSHKDKLEICRKICDAITKLEKYKISYWDIHSENILINGKDIRICDMDSVTSKNIDGDYSYRSDLSDSYRYLTSIMLSILYEMDEFDLIKNLKRKKSRKFVKESEMFKRVANSEGYIFYPDKYLDIFTEDYVNETKALIRR